MYGPKTSVVKQYFTLDTVFCFTSEETYYPNFHIFNRDLDVYKNSCPHTRFLVISNIVSENSLVI